MKSIKAYLANQAKSPLEPGMIHRRNPKPLDVVIQITHCGVCHSDVHQARGEWGEGIFPMVPGHEIIGNVIEVGDQVSKFKVGDRVGVGCLVDACRSCQSCHEHEEQYCENGFVLTYNGYEKDNTTPTYGGYSSHIVVDQDFVLSIPVSLSSEHAAPLLCAGITTYSPLKHWNIQAGDQVAVLGLGGLGHMGVKFAVAMGAEVTVISTSPEKEKDARLFGAKHFICSKDENQMQAFSHYFKLILNTVGADIDLSRYLQLLNLNGTLVCVGVPEKPLSLSPRDLIFKRRQLAGSLIGGLKQTQEMLNYCGAHQIQPEIELIPIQDINHAYDRMIKNDVRYRFVIDMSSL